MARPLRIQFPGAMYHVFARGNNKQLIFADDADRKRLLRLLWQVAEHFDWDVLAYCLMGNHYHLLLETKTPTLARGMQQLNSRYSQTFNYRHRRVGHVLQGRYGAVLVQSGIHLLEVARYIALNPVRANLCGRPEQWRWSSYAPMVGQRVVHERLVGQRLLSNYSGSSEEARSAFRRFVLAGIGLEGNYDEQSSAIAFGDPMFVAGLEIYARQASSEVRRTDRAWKSLRSFATEFVDREGAIRAAYVTGLYSRAAIAHHFGVPYSYVRRLTPSKSKKQI